MVRGGYKVKVKFVIILSVTLISLTGCLDKGDTSTPSQLETNTATATPISSGLIIEQLTLEQAQEKVQFKILVPKKLPEGITFKDAYLGDGTAYVTEPKDKAVVMNFGNGKEGFLIIEQQGTMGHLDRETIKKLKINNNQAEYSNDEKQFEPTLLWQTGNVVCRIYTNNRSSFSDEKGLKEIAESLIPLVDTK